MRRYLKGAQIASVVLAACALAVGAGSASAGATSASPSPVVFTDAPGTSAPPPTLGPYTMAGFAPDSQPAGGEVSGVAAPEGTLGFSPSLEHDLVGGGWGTWSNGYTGDVYVTGSDTLTLTLPQSTNAFYFYAEPSEYQVLAITATNSDGTTSGAVPVEGQGAAEYFGFYSTDSTPLTSITVTTADPDGFAVGEFGVSQGAFTVKGALAVQPSTSQSEHEQGEACETTTFLADKALGYAIAAGFDLKGYADAGRLLRHFLSGSTTPINFPDGSTLSSDLLSDPNFNALNASVQAAIAVQLEDGDTTVELTRPPLERIGLYIPNALYFAFAGTQGLKVAGSGNFSDGHYTGTLTYTLEDSYGFSVSDLFYHDLGQRMRYLQTNCGAPQRKGGAHWFPDSVTITVPFSIPTASRTLTSRDRNS
jgi:hypothetical protein